MSDQARRQFTVTRRRILVLAAAVAAAFAGAPTTFAQAPAQPLYKDASQPVERRIEDLLARMTLEEKVAQLVTVWERKARIQTPAGQFSADKASQAFPHGLGQIARPSDKRGVTVANAGAAGRRRRRSTAMPATRPNMSTPRSDGRRARRGSAFRC